MPQRNSNIVWGTTKDFTQNQSRNLRPTVIKTEIVNNTLTPIGRRGECFYSYDFGGIGKIGDLNFEGSGFISFRYKIADSLQELKVAEYIGSKKEEFVGQTIDTNYWIVANSDYNISQNNLLSITGSTLDYAGIYQSTASLTTLSTTEFPAAFEVRMRMEKVPGSSGAHVFAGVTDGANTVLVRKAYEKLTASSSKADILVDTNVGNIATTEVVRNTGIVIQERTNLLSDGILEKIDYFDIPTKVVDTLVDLKRYAYIPSIVGDPISYGVSAEAIPFQIRADYNPEQSPLDFRKYLHYQIVRDAGFYRATVPVVNRKIDLYETELRSFNWNSTTRVYEEADTNNVWKIALTLPPGIYRYNFFVDGKETPDLSNPNSYYLDAANNKISIFKDGYSYENSQGIYIPAGAPFFSEITLREIQTVEFLFQGYGKIVTLVGTFNDFNPKRHPLEQVVDRQVIRRLADPNFIYINDTPDYHKIEITLPNRTSINTIDFSTLIPRSDRQRVKIYFDEVPVSRLDWNLIQGRKQFQDELSKIGIGEDIELSLAFGYGYGVPITGYGVHYGYGVGYGIDYGYGHLTGYGSIATGYGNGLEQTCSITQDICSPTALKNTPYSYWDNNTDVITASEDVIVRWCLKPGIVRTAKKITFLSRIEGSTVKTRKHLSLDFYGSLTQSFAVTDYALSDSYCLVQQTHSTYTTPLQQWQLPITNLYSGLNEITTTTYDKNGNPIFGEPLVIRSEAPKPTIWELNKSEWAGHSAEIIYGIAGCLRGRPLKMFSITDDRSLNPKGIQLPTERFSSLHIQKLVTLSNVEIQPSMNLVVKMVGLYSTFIIEFYNSIEDARESKNQIGFVTANSYGAKFPSDFSGNYSGSTNFFALDQKIEIAGIQTPIIVGNIVATYEQGGADKIIQIGQVR